MRNRGGFNRRTGKTTPRNKGKTHWGKKGSVKRTPTSKKTAKSGAPAKAKA
jgi:hypothetical protein